MSKSLKALLCFSALLCLEASATSQKFKLGQFLFFDKVISGNKNISCATCHHPLAFSGDGLSLGLGEGAIGLGITRAQKHDVHIHERVPRNAPALFNAGSKHIKKYFHDGRVEYGRGYPSGIKSPAGMDLPEGMDDLLAVQSIFPITSTTEMAGQDQENEISKYASVNDFPGVWREVTKRVVAIPEYVELFKQVYPAEVKTKNDITIKHIGNAIAHFEEEGFKADNAPFDRYRAGDKTALNTNQIKGMQIFYGKGKCASCHSGILQTDNKFHSIAIPPIGEGKGVGYNKMDDWGREMVSEKKEDRYKFRTPTLRNIVVTAPYGHNGAYNTLEGIIKHHLNPRKALFSYTLDKASLPTVKHSKDDVLLKNKVVLNEIANSSAIKEIPLNDSEVNLLVQFLHSLTDERCLDMRKLVPQRVPSNLPIYE